MIKQDIISKQSKLFITSLINPHCCTYKGLKLIIQIKIFSNLLLTALNTCIRQEK